MSGHDHDSSDEVPDPQTPRDVLLELEALLAMAESENEDAGDFGDHWTTVVDATEALRLAIAETDKLRELIGRAMTGEDSPLVCPICGEKWIDGPTRPHAPGCELAAALEGR
jgi:hypothetical protein